MTKLIVELQQMAEFVEERRLNKDISSEEACKLQVNLVIATQLVRIADAVEAIANNTEPPAYVDPEKRR